MAQTIRCDLRAAMKATNPASSRSSETPSKAPVKIPAESERSANAKILLQPRLCTLRSYGPDPVVLKAPRRAGEARGGDALATSSTGSAPSPFFEALSEYMENTKKSQDFEIVSGRLAMMVFAATVTSEVVTGNSLFGKADLQGIEAAAAASFAAVTLAAAFAWFSSARSRVGGLFAASCNTFIDGLIDQIVDGLFYENELMD